VGVLKRNFLLLLLAILIIGSSITPSMAQSAVTYNIHVDFFYASCSLSNVLITLHDQTGRVVAETQIPDAYEVTLTYTAAPTSSLTVTVFAQATIGSYYAGSVSGTRTIAVGNGGDYWALVQLR